MANTYLSGSAGDMIKAVPNSGTSITGVTAMDYSNGKFGTTELTVTDVTLLAQTVGAHGYGKLLYTFPTGQYVISSAYMSMEIDSISAANDGDTPDVGIGTVIATGGISVLGGTATFEDIMTGLAATDQNGTTDVRVVVGQPMTVLTAAAHTVHFNIADTFAGSDAGPVINGKIVLEWMKV